jgi:aarF domain-containing kinase
MPQHVEPLKEVERSFLTEFDYRQEAANMEEVRRNVVPRFGHRIALPHAMEEICTKEVLVMERLPVRLSVVSYAECDVSLLFEFLFNPVMIEGRAVLK